MAAPGPPGYKAWIDLLNDKIGFVADVDHSQRRFPVLLCNMQKLFALGKQYETAGDDAKAYIMYKRMSKNTVNLLKTQQCKADAAAERRLKDWLYAALGSLEQLDKNFRQHYEDTNRTRAALGLSPLTDEQPLTVDVSPDEPPPTHTVDPSATEGEAQALASESKGVSAKDWRRVVSRFGGLTNFGAMAGSGGLHQGTYISQQEASSKYVTLPSVPPPSTAQSGAAGACPPPAAGSGGSAAGFESATGLRPLDPNNGVIGWAPGHEGGAGVAASREQGGMIRQLTGGPMCDGLREVHVPGSLMDRFTAIAAANSAVPPRGIETCGVLCGRVQTVEGGEEALVVTHCVLPPQRGQSDSCEMTDEGALFEWVASRDLVVVGWIHTHPSQTCFMSSFDVRTHLGFQMMMPEAIAIVCAPTDPEVKYGIWRLTPEGVEQVSQRARQQTGGAFMSARGVAAEAGVVIYESSTHVGVATPDGRATTKVLSGPDAVELVDIRRCPTT